MFNGGAILARNNTHITLTNSILWGNRSKEKTHEVYLDSSSTIDVTYSDTEYRYIGIGNRNDNPSFVSAPPASVIPTTAGNFRLTSSSYCIDRGTANSAPNKDIEGILRPQGSGYDMGAYEYTPGIVVECDHDGDVNEDGVVTPQDALLAFRYYLDLIELDECRQDHADVNGDGVITPADALCIFRYYLELSSCLD